MVLAVWFVSFSFADEDCQDRIDFLEDCETDCVSRYTDCLKQDWADETSCKNTKNLCFSICNNDAEDYDCDEEILSETLERRQNECPNLEWRITLQNMYNIKKYWADLCCWPDRAYDDWNNTWCCLDWIVQPDTENSGKLACVQNYYGTMWLDINTECLLNWQCHMNVYRTLWIRKSDDDPEVQTFVQDIILGATEFIGTVITVVLMISGLFYIISAMNGKTELSWRAKKAIIWSIVWLLFVTLSYSIIRLIQFLATWWS